MKTEAEYSLMDLLRCVVQGKYNEDAGPDGRVVPGGICDAGKPVSSTIHCPYDYRAYEGTIAHCYR